MSTYGTPPVDYRNPAAPEAVCECDNCGHRCASHELGPVHDPDERIDDDGPEPEGECPECGCLSYVVDPPMPSPEQMCRDLCALPGSELPADLHLYGGLYKTLSRRARP